jgi:hypothetical protein
MTTIKLLNGDMGSEVMLVRCNLAQASAPVEVDYCNDGPRQHGNNYEHTQYQCADTRHTRNGLVKIAKQIAAQAMEANTDDFDCEIRDC